MPAKSQAQQRFFGMVAAGKVNKPHGMTETQVNEFASTPRKRLPEKMHASMDTSRKPLPERMPRKMADGGMMPKRMDDGGRNIMQRRTTMVPEEGAIMPKRKMPTITMPPKMADGKKKEPFGWAKKAFSSAHGQLHEALHVPKDETIPAGKLSKATRSQNPHMRHMAQAAENIRSGR